MPESYDYIIVGAGSAGCVLANRLSADPHNRVLVLEAGGPDRSPLVRMPKGVGKLVTDPNYSWHFPVQQPRVAGAPSREVWVSGKTVGGSSSINGMIYVRGQPEDYDEWERRGATGWNWNAMLPAFKSIESHELGASDERGDSGPVHVSTGKFSYPLAEKLIEAGQQMGLARREDLNSGDREGVGYYLHNIRNGRRVSAADAFLKPVYKRGNFRLITRAQVLRVLFRGQRASGVVARVNGTEQSFAAEGEVILSAGGIQSPKLLQQSGIGDGALLKRFGIPVLVDCPAVGNGLRDHLGYALPHRLLKQRGINHRFHGFGLLWSLLQYYGARSGPLATGPFEVGAFVRTGPNAKRPDAQLFMGAFTFARSGDQFPVPLQTAERKPGITIYGQILQPTSEGTVCICSPDPEVPPAIAPNWLSTGEDQLSAIAIVRYMRRYMTQPAIRPYVGEELVPGADCQSDEDILFAVRNGSTAGLHAVATCRMGCNSRSVVDPKLRVNGVSHLRVVDCSVMPSLPSGNTNAPAMALGWRAAEVILSDRHAAG